METPLGLVWLGAMALRTAALFVIIVSALPAYAEQRHNRFEVLAGISPIGCGEGGCAVAVTEPGIDVGATGWLLERVGLSARVRGRSGFRWLEPSVRLRGFVGANRDREVDFGVGRGIFPAGAYYHSSWKVGALVGFRTRERIGVKVGGELFYVWFQRNRNPDGGRSLDAGLLFTVALVVRP